MRKAHATDGPAALTCGPARTGSFSGPLEISTLTSFGSQHAQSPCNATRQPFGQRFAMVSKPHSIASLTLLFQMLGLTD